MQVVTSDGRRLSVRELPGAGVPVVLGHSLASSSEDLTALAEAFARRGHRVLWFDQRGHGASDAAGPVTIGQLAEDVIDVIDHHDARGAVAVGHSSGGYALIALGNRAADFVSRIVTIGTSPQLTSLIERATMAYAKSQVMLRVQQVKPIGTAIVRVGSFGPNADRRKVERVWTSVCQCGPATRRSFVDAMLAARSLTSEVAELNVPLIALRGAHDRVVSRRSVEQLARAASLGQYIEISGAGHMLPVENPGAVVDAGLG